MTSYQLITIAGFLYLTAMIFYTASVFFGKSKLGSVATGISVVGCLLHLAGFISRAYEFYKVNEGSVMLAVPVTNLYESLQFFALLLILANIVIELRSGIRLIGAFTSGTAGAAVLFTDSIGASTKVEPLVPALQSNWLLAHVSMSFIAYVFFALSAITAYIYLISVSKNRKQPSYIFWTIVTGIGVSALFGLLFDVLCGLGNGGLDQVKAFSTFKSNITPVRGMYALFTILMIYAFWFYGLKITSAVNRLKPNLDKLDSLTYQFAVTGFSIFTVGGLIFGAIWADQAWGRYWNWDPKETWAFITWALYAIYLHGRFYGKWNKLTANTLAVIGFMLTIFTFLGVNLLLSGLHSYGGL